MAASTSELHRVLEIKPCEEMTAEALAACISSSTLPPGDNEAEEKRDLKRRGWKDPRGLMCYSKSGAYKDLYAYFDFADRSSPINRACTKAFRCYGLDGAQHVMNWEEIRGSCIIVRAEDPLSFTASSFGPTQGVGGGAPRGLTISEMVDTLLFFQDKDARKVALTRDAERTTRGIAGALPPGMPTDFLQSGQYAGPAGSRPLSKVAGKDTATCMVCGMTAASCGGLKHCSACKVVQYCSEECQKQDWKRHKKESPSCAPKRK